MNTITYCTKALVAFILCVGIMLSGPTMALAANPVVGPSGSKLFTGLKIPTYVWAKKNGKPKAVVVGIHGGCLHGRSYDSFARKLAANDVMFVSYDMRGFGKWYHNDYGTKDDRTFNFDKTISDTSQILSRIRKTYPGVPVFLAGESLGANIAVYAAAEKNQRVDGLILSNPMVAPKLFLSPRMLVNAVQVLVNPFGKLDWTPYLKSRLSESSELAEMAIEDPLSRNEHSLFEFINTLSMNVKGKMVMDDLSPDLPLLVVVGQKDKLCSPKATERLFKKLNSTNRTLYKMPSRGHLIIEAKKVDPAIVKQVVSWVKRQPRTAIARAR